MIILNQVVLNSYISIEYIPMDEVLDNIIRMGAIRGVPQFLFMDNVFPHATIEVREAINSFVEKNDGVKEVDLILQSPGGLPDHAYRIIRTFRKNFETVNCVVPFWAKSAATLIGFGSSTIIMDEFGEFGPLDAQIGKEREDRPEFDRKSALNDEHSLRIIEERYKDSFESLFQRIYSSNDINIPKTDLSNQLLDNLSRFYEPLMSQINPYQLGEKRRSLDIGGHYALRILAAYSTISDVASLHRIVDFLVHECPDHGYVVDKDILDLLGFNNVVNGSDIGEDYASLLSDLSLMMMNINSDKYYVGFVEKRQELPEQEMTVSAQNNDQELDHEKMSKKIQQIAKNGIAKQHGKK